MTLILTLTFAFALTTNGGDDAAKERATGEPKKATLSAFDWMLGSWTLTTKSGITTESWSRESDILFRGASVMMRGKDTSFTEQLTLVHDSLGIAYIALPRQNSEPTRFSLTVWDKDRAIFENPAHDFPKQISYHFRAPDTLHARIEGQGKDGKTKGIDFVYTREKK